MATDDADALVPFQDVRILRVTAAALFCGVGDKRVWLPRLHTSGRLWSRGDRGTLFIRRWVADDRHLLPAVGAPPSALPDGPVGRSRPRGHLSLVRRDGAEGSTC